MWKLLVQMDGALRASDFAMDDKYFLPLSTFSLEFAFILIYISPSLEK